MALVRSDPFRELDRLAQQVWGFSNGSRSLAMPMDAYRKGDSFLIQFDLPGIDVESIDLTVEDSVLTVKAEHPAPPMTEGVEKLVAERLYGTFTRQVFLGQPRHRTDRRQLRAGRAHAIHPRGCARQASAHPDHQARREAEALRLTDPTVAG